MSYDEGLPKGADYEKADILDLQDAIVLRGEDLDNLRKKKGLEDKAYAYEDYSRLRKTQLIKRLREMDAEIDSILSPAPAPTPAPAAEKPAPVSAPSAEPASTPAAASRTSQVLAGSPAPATKPAPSPRPAPKTVPPPAAAPAPATKPAPAPRPVPKTVPPPAAAPAPRPVSKTVPPPAAAPAPRPVPKPVPTSRPVPAPAPKTSAGAANSGTNGSNNEQMLKRRIEELETMYNAAQSAHANLQEAYDALQKTHADYCDETQAYISQQETEIQNLRAEKKNASSLTAPLQLQVTELEICCEEYRLKADLVNQKLDSNIKVLESVRNELMAKVNQLAEIESKLKKSERELVAQKKENEILQSDNDSLRAEVSKYKSQISDLKKIERELVAQKKANEILQSEVSKYKSQISDRVDVPSASAPIQHPKVPQPNETPFNTTFNGGNKNNASGANKDVLGKLFS